MLIKLHGTLMRVALSRVPPVRVIKPDIEKSLGGRHWYDCPPKRRLALEHSFRGLARVDFSRLRPACVAYLYPPHFEKLGDDELLLRQYDVAILAHGKYYDAYRGQKHRWYGPPDVFTETGGWARRQGRLRITWSNEPLLFGPGYNALGELDDLHRAAIRQHIKNMVRRRL